MGKNIKNQNSGISLENSHPGCMWSVLHVLHYNRWHHVKKIIPYKKHTSSGSKKNADPESSSTNTTSIAESPNESVKVTKQTAHAQKPDCGGEKGKEASQGTKVPRRYRLISMFTDEMYKRKGRHRRDSCPIQQPNQQTNYTKQLDSSDKDTPAVASVKDRQNVAKKDEDRTSSVESHTHTPKAADEEPVTKNKNCELCAAMLTASYSTKKADISDNADGHQKAEEESSSPPEESKEFLNALDIFNMRKEMFLKGIQEPKSPMTHHLQSPRISSSDKRLTKCESLSMKLGEVDYSNNFPPCSPRPLTNQHDSAAVLKHFKNLKQKLTHVIRESRKEKQRILMDGILHKVPYGHRLSKDPKETDPSLRKSNQKQFKRAASLNESVDKYCRLFESSFTNESKQKKSENFKLKVESMTPKTSKKGPKILARIQSLQDMRYYENYPVSTPDKNFADKDLFSRLGTIDEQETEDPRSQSQLDSSDEIGGDDASLRKRAKSFDDLTISMNGENSVGYEHETEHTSAFAKLEKPCPDSDIYRTASVDILEPKDFDIQMPTTEIENIEIPTKQNCIDFEHARAVRKDSMEFNYVKDVLQVAGFGGTDFLRTWHTTGQPVDHSVFAELGGCLLEEPEASVNEEADKCNHLLLFDLINEVLLDIHERSFTYCPVPLTCRSDIHPMPVGYHVLEEVWDSVDRYLSWQPEFEPSLDDAVSKDLARGDGWMNLQLEAECVGLELEDLIFDELLDEFIWE